MNKHFDKKGEMKTCEYSKAMWHSKEKFLIINRTFAEFNVDYQLNQWNVCKHEVIKLALNSDKLFSIPA